VRLAGAAASRASSLSGSTLTFPLNRARATNPGQRRSGPVRGARDGRERRTHERDEHGRKLRREPS